MANLGAASIGGYSSFIKSMLDLREQRLEEEKLKQAERMANQKQMMSMIGDIGSSITQYGGQMAQNKMANQLMAEQYGAPPRAQAVDASLQGPADAAAARMPGFYTGGMPELKMRMAMAEDQSQADYRSAMINRMEGNLKFQKSKFLVDQATKAGARSSKELNAGFDDSMSYITKRKAVMDAIQNAETPEQHEVAVNSLSALDMAAKKRGLDMSAIDTSKIPPFMTQDEKDALATQQTAVGNARTELEAVKSAEPGLIDRTRAFLGLGTGSGALGLPPIPTQQQSAIKSAQELYEKEQQKLRDTPGSSYYGDKPVKPTTTAPKEAGGKGGTGDTVPLEIGTRRKGRTSGRVQIWNGKEWVDET